MNNPSTVTMPFNAAQLELLQLFAGGVNDEDLKSLRQILTDFKFNRITQMADKILAEKGWSGDDLATQANKMGRTPYKSKKNASSSK